METGICLEMVFTDQPFLKRIKMAGRAGFTRAEMWFTDGTFNGAGCQGDPKDPAKVKQAARAAGLTITNAVIGSPDGGLGGGLTDPARRKEFLKRAETTFEFCRQAGIGAAIVCTGNTVKGRTRAQMVKSVREGLKAVVKLAEKQKITLLLEPLNDKVDHAGYLLTGSAEGAHWCREIGSERLKLLYDCYHMQIMEGDLCRNIRRHQDVIGHFHAAGHPGRHEVWLGEVNYPFVINEIKKTGYKGIFAFEYLPSLPVETSLAKTLAYYKTGKES